MRDALLFILFFDPFIGQRYTYLFNLGESHYTRKRLVNYSTIVSSTMGAGRRVGFR